MEMLLAFLGFKRKQQHKLKQETAELLTVDVLIEA